MNPQNSADALGQLKTVQQSAKNPQAFLAEQQQSLGVPSQQEAVQGLRGAIANTTKLLNNVAPSVAGRAANSLVTAAGAQRQIANEQAPIASNLQTQGQQYSQAAQDLADIQNKALQQAQLQYQGQQDQVSYLQNLYNTYYQREQADQQRQAEEAARQEQIRQFNAQLAASKGSGGSSAGGVDLSSIFGQSGGSPSMTKGSNGLQFTSNGKPITAAQYVQMTGGNTTTLRNILKDDKNSQKAYNDFISGKYTSSQLASKYPYIFGGV